MAKVTRSINVIPIVTEVSDTANATTSSSTDALLTTMTITPTVAGNYQVLFNSSITSNAAGAAITVSIYVGGVQDPATVIKLSPFDGGTLSATTARAVAFCLKKVTTNGSQSIEIHWSISSGTGTCGPRVMQISRCL